MARPTRDRHPQPVRAQDKRRAHATHEPSISRELVVEVPLTGLSFVAWAGMFAVGVLAICLVRRPMMAAILALGLIVAVLVFVDWLVVPSRTPRFCLEVARDRFVAFAGGMLAMSVAGTVAARWASSRDIAIIR
jgi:hypothetical protein